MARQPACMDSKACELLNQTKVSVRRFVSKDGATRGGGSRTAFFGQSKRGTCPVAYPKQSIKVVPHLSASPQPLAYHRTLPAASQLSAGHLTELFGDCRF